MASANAADVVKRHAGMHTDGSTAGGVPMSNRRQTTNQDPGGDVGLNPQPLPPRSLFERIRRWVDTVVQRAIIVVGGRRR